MKKRTKLGVMVGFVLGCQALAIAEFGPVANLTEKWSTDANWKLYGEAVKVYNGDSLTMKFAAINTTADVPPTPPKVGKLAADATSSAGRFTGDFANAGIEEVAFDIKAENASRTFYLGFINASRTRYWQHAVVLDEDASGWVHVTVPFDFEAGWTTPQGGGLAEFTADRAAVGQINLLTSGGGPVEQKLTVDNFKVVGPWSGDFTQDGLPVNWLKEYGMTEVEGHATGDADGDGFNNYGEFLAGTDPNDKNSLFAVTIDRNEAGQAVLRWKHEIGRHFSVLKAGSLASGFGVLSTEIASKRPENEIVIDEQDEGAYFYRVRIDR